MAREILPNKLIIEINENNEIKNAIYQYRIRENGSVQNRFFTMNVKNDLTLEKINQILLEAKQHTEQGEGL